VLGQKTEVSGDVAMKISVKKGELKDSTTGAAVVVHFEDSKKPEGAAAAVDEHCKGPISGLLKAGIVRGKLFETNVVNTGGLIKPGIVVVVGLGLKKDFNLERVRGAFSKAAQKVRALNITDCAVSLDFDFAEHPLSKIAESAVEGAMLGLYQFTPFKTVDRDEIKEISEIVIMDPRASLLKMIRQGVRRGEIIARAVYYARDLVSTPSNEMTPTILANRAREAGKGRNVKITVTGASAMQRLGMNAFLGVARGSYEDPKLITMEYSGGKKAEQPIVLVGKGITFDSGGISIKPAAGMDEMKDDMAGGAAVIGTLMAAADLKIPLNIVGIVPATENLPGGGAYKPGDVLTSMSGKTIEIKNTDAEGRLILVDAFAYAQRYKPAAMIDLATLTGACVIALGRLIIGMWGNDDTLREGLRAASEATGEKLWEMPLPEEYEEQLKSDVADLKNVGSREGGAISAAIFLSRFIGDHPWVHLDIAGPAWLDKERPYIPRGASGIGVRLLIEYLENRSKKATGKAKKKA
jgi:leucyl aminopeptidase